VKKAQLIVVIACLLLAIIAPVALLSSRLRAEVPCVTYTMPSTCTAWEPTECSDWHGTTQAQCEANPEYRLFSANFKCFDFLFGNTICVPELNLDGSAKTAVCRRGYACIWTPLMGGRCNPGGEIPPPKREPVYLTESCDDD